MGRYHALQGLFQAFFGGFQGEFDVELGVGGGDERSFELGGGEKYATVEHIAEIFGVAPGVRFFGGGVIADRLTCEKERGERTDGIDLSGDFLCADDFPETGNEGTGKLLDALLEAGLAELIEGGNAGTHREGLPERVPAW